MTGRRTCLLTVAVCAAGWLSAGPGVAVEPLQDKALRTAIVPDADFLVTVDAVGWRQAPIQATFEAIQAEMAAKAATGNPAGPPQARIDARVNQLLETLGIAKDDLVAMVFSARVRGLDALEGSRKTPQLAFQQLGLVMAFRVAKPVSIAKVRLALGNAAAEGGMELMFEKGDYHGATTLSVVRPDQPGKTSWMPSAFMVALLDGDTAGYIGGDADVKAALDRFSTSAPAAFTTALKTAQDGTVPGALTRLFFIPSDTLRANARENAAKMQAQNPMFGGAMQAVAGLQNVTLGAKGSDRISLQVAGSFASAQDALQMKTMLDAMLLGMGKMMLMQAVGRPIPLIESLASRQDGATTSITADLTEEDCRALAELRTSATRGMPPFPGGPGVPQGVPGGAPVAPAN